MTTTREQFGLLARGTPWTRMVLDVYQDLPSRVRRHVKVCTHWHDKLVRSTQSFYLVSSLSQMTEDQELSEFRALSRECRLLAFTDKLPTESIPERLFLLQVRSGERVHLAPHLDDHKIRSFLARFMEGLASTWQDRAIADAWWDGEEYAVISPRFERVRIPLNALPPQLRNASRAAREHFQIDGHGDFVYWPELDVHMGWDQFAQAVDPMGKLKAEQKGKDFNERYGRAIRSLHEASGLKQQAIEGLDERTVRRIEQGQTRATANAIAKLAKAHTLGVPGYMSALAKYL